MATTTITLKLEPSEYTLLKLAVEDYRTTCEERAKVAGGTDRQHWQRQVAAARSLASRM